MYFPMTMKEQNMMLNLKLKKVHKLIPKLKV